jgi:hypothetical protein
MFTSIDRPSTPERSEGTACLLSLAVLWCEIPTNIVGIARLNPWKIGREFGEVEVLSPLMRLNPAQDLGAQ